MDKIEADQSKFIDIYFQRHNIVNPELAEKLKACYIPEEFSAILATVSKEAEYRKNIENLSGHYKNEWKWEKDPISEYLTRVYLKPNLPKFLYYDEYYSLPSEVIIEELKTVSAQESEEKKTARALFELADINISQVTKSNNFENFIAELEGNSGKHF